MVHHRGGPLRPLRLALRPPHTSTCRHRCDDQQRESPRLVWTHAHSDHVLVRVVPVYESGCVLGAIDGTKNDEIDGDAEIGESPERRYCRPR